MKKCEHCGYINNDIFKVCKKCGRGLPKESNITESEYRQAIRAQTEQSEKKYHDEAEDKVSPSELRELIRSVNTIKKCCVFFVALTILTIVAGTLMVLLRQS